MSTFDPQKLSVTFLPPATAFSPVAGRAYTLTHSDITAELFLYIGFAYNEQALNMKMRDEVLARWQRGLQGRLQLAGHVYVDGGEYSQEAAGARFTIFQRELPTALQAIVYGDRLFYGCYPDSLQAPIILSYHSAYPQYRHVYHYGTPQQYLQQSTGISCQ